MRPLVLLLATLLMASACGKAPEPDASRVRVAAALGGDSEGFAQATAPRDFHFPQDHGPHPEYRNEWWYLTGNLQDQQGRRFGFQATFFRIALAPQDHPRQSAWSTRQVWMAHAALTDVAGRKHLAEERFARQALGLAGARAEPFRVWLEDWEIVSEPAGGGWKLRLRSDDFALDLDLLAQRDPLLQGDAGLSRKNAMAGNASYYYSIPRLRVRGQIELSDGSHEVEGLAWLDREWSTSALHADQVGWDWFALHLADGRDLMFYQLRDRDGQTDRHSAGSWVDAEGRQTPLSAQQVRLTPLEWWTAPDHRRYPVAWELSLPESGETLRVEALLPQQWMDLSVRYWEGAVDVIDPRDRTRLGFGYMELTGY